MTTNSPNYVERIRRELVASLPDCDGELIDLYTLLAIQYGSATDLVHVHNAWAVWRNRTRPDHKSLIPFAYLSREVQELDRPYVEAIHAADRKVFADLVAETKALKVASR